MNPQTGFAFTKPPGFLGEALTCTALPNFSQSHHLEELWRFLGGLKQPKPEPNAHLTPKGADRTPQKACSKGNLFPKQEEPQLIINSPGRTLWLGKYGSSGVTQGTCSPSERLAPPGTAPWQLFIWGFSTRDLAARRISASQGKLRATGILFFLTWKTVKWW